MVIVDPFPCFLSPVKYFIFSSFKFCAQFHADSAIESPPSWSKTLLIWKSNLPLLFCLRLNHIHCYSPPYWCYIISYFVIKKYSTFVKLNCLNMAHIDEQFYKLSKCMHAHLVKCYLSSIYAYSLHSKTYKLH